MTMYTCTNGDELYIILQHLYVHVVTKNVEDLCGYKLAMQKDVHVYM